VAATTASDELAAAGVTSANWLDAPWNRLGFRRVPELVRTARIGGGSGPPSALPRAVRDLGAFSFEHEGRELDLESLLRETYTDGLAIVHAGALVYERYLDSMAPADTHLLMSVSKSMNAALCGALAGLGALSPDDLAAAHVEELRGTAWEGCTVQHLLDMRVGARWDYDVDEYTILDVSDYRTHERAGIPADTATWILTVERDAEHGGPFAYNSLANDVLGWVLERAGGSPWAELFSRHVWSPLGAEADAFVMLDRSGFPIVEGGVCTTLRDLARFGLMHLQDGQIEGRRVVPAEWVGRLLVHDPELVAAFGDDGGLGGPRGKASYHDNWWIWDAERGIYAAVGMNGQCVFVHRPSGTAIAKLSTFPDALDERLFALHHAGLAALCEWL
jgi:CubicO group peptidase (beta-lactamase class C family)